MPSGTQDKKGWTKTRQAIALAIAVPFCSGVFGVGMKLVELYPIKKMLAETEAQLEVSVLENFALRTELEHQQTVVDLPRMMKLNQHILEHANQLMLESNVDRVLLLHANNGYIDPRWVTADIQLHEDGNAIMEYRHYPVDEDYRGRLVDIARHGSRLYEVATMPKDAEIRKIYETEGVTWSMWSYIGNHYYPEKKLVVNGEVKIAKPVSHVFISTATKGDGFDSVAIQGSKVLTALIKEAFIELHGAERVVSNHR